MKVTNWKDSILDTFCLVTEKNKTEIIFINKVLKKIIPFFSSSQGTTTFSNSEIFLHGDLGSHSIWGKLDYVCVHLNNKGGSSKNPYRNLA